MMQACGPVVRPHEILQTLIISIPQPSAAVKSFFELSRNLAACNIKCERTNTTSNDGYAFYRIYFFTINRAKTQ